MVVAAQQSYRTACNRHWRLSTAATRAARSAASTARDAAVANAKQSYWQRFQSMLQDDKQRLVWSTFKASKGSAANALSSVKDAAGVLPKSPAEALLNMTNYYASVSDDRAVPAVPSADSEIAALLGDPSAVTYPGNVPCATTDALWSLDLIATACSRVHQSALGPDNVHAVFLKQGGDLLHQCLLVMLCGAVLAVKCHSHGAKQWWCYYIRKVLVLSRATIVPSV